MLVLSGLAGGGGMLIGAAASGEDKEVQSTTSLAQDKACLDQLKA